MTKISSLEAELRCFWDASYELHRIRRAEADPEQITAAVEELEAIGEYSEWPALKLICARTSFQSKAAIYNRAANA